MIKRHIEANVSNIDQMLIMLGEAKTKSEFNRLSKHIKILIKENRKLEGRRINQ